MKPTIYDTDCLSCFVTINYTEILEELFEKIYIPIEVYDEFNNQKTIKLKNRIDRLIEKGFVEILDTCTDSEDYELFLQLYSDFYNDKPIGKGESAVIVMAKKYNGIVASNNTKDIIPYIKKYGLERITTGDILIMAFKKGLINEKEGNSIWFKMLAYGRWLNAETFSDYLNLNEDNLKIY
ncbi:MAG: nucleic acid-binding protein [Methanobrevibacter sp.]|nr:nucleic acid-binding protein [Methanobrevibacter sp.]